MKRAKFAEGSEIAEKFEEAMKILFRTPKSEKEQRTPAPSVRKTKPSDKD